MLLPYCVRFPIIHAIVIEKDSRRIFYFMMYAQAITMRLSSVCLANQINM